MRLVVQRVRKASVETNGREVAAIGPGLLALAGFSASGESPERLARMAHRLVTLRAFDDASGRINRSLQDVQGELLIVPQFTLTASLDKGARPSFHTAAPPDTARQLFDQFLQAAQALHAATRAGIFQASMLVRLENDGPVTFILEDA